VSEILAADFSPLGKQMERDNCKAIKNAFIVVSIITRSFVSASSDPVKAFQNTKLGGTAIHADDGMASVNSKDKISVSSTTTAEPITVRPVTSDNIGIIFSSALILVKEFGEAAKEHVDSTFLERIVKDGAEGLHKFDMGATDAKERCDKMSRPVIPAGHKGEKAEKVLPPKDALTRELIRITSSTREVIPKILDMILAGNAVAHQKVNYLYELMSRQAWTEAARHRFESFDEAYVFLHPTRRQPADFKKACHADI